MIIVVGAVECILFGSVAILSDSLHNFSDAMSLLASYLAIRIGERRRTRSTPQKIKIIEGV